jgi:hypothetical protein
MVPHLEFNDEDDALEAHNGIDALTHARNGKFQGDPSIIQVAKLFLEKLFLLDPSIALEQIEIVRVLCSEMSQDGLRVFVQKACDCQRIMGLLH